MVCAVDRASIIYSRAEGEDICRSERPVIGDKSLLAQAVHTVGRFISRRVGPFRKSLMGAEMTRPISVAEPIE